MTEGRIHIDGLKPADVALLKQVASEAAELAVVKTFIAMGIDATKPLDAQADMLFLRSTRQRCESIGFKAVLTMMGLVMAGAAGLIWVGFKTSMKSSLPFALPLMLSLINGRVRRTGRHPLDGLPLPLLDTRSAERLRWHPLPIISPSA
jgi:hypothetical protein